MRYDESENEWDYFCEDLRGCAIWSAVCLVAVAVLAALVTLGFIYRWLLTV
jgi:hypothetical protein